MIAPVNKMIPLSVVDGPGCRTAVFVQGCNIACAYCHNPETQRLCIDCGICVSQCPAGALFLSGTNVIWDEAACTQCDNCIRVCPNYASPKVRWMKAMEVWEQIERNMPFIQGITVSGGECSLYPEFLTELFTLAGKAGLSCYLDSNGCVDFSRYPKLMAVTDKVMLDVKAWDYHVFHRLTGGDNRLVKKNLKYLAETGKLHEVRLVCLEAEASSGSGQADDREVDMEDVIAGVADEVRPYLEEFKLKLIAFRNFGVKGKMETRKSPPPEQMEKLKELAVKCGFNNIQIV
ncbi:YjjW family glycine radical enzyme activase [Lacrimispora indolis]|uniref:YjjW family glycine radical enzyme activase n=1 Tax=Lacrimispora indolis TaxID=69825 RepID=UPI000462745D|nr:YjjW family glycine radical enzyme activase [[Clostridium] methoxybenzovorans]